ncbi:hypothetical protein CPT_Palo_029 [Rhizobium phage Palo]|uniref:Uncharacterized protein n=1 Tax=Rhizobium phage Palo TaxID=2767573 RepID=A0A7L8G6Y1_9CAUD|nr:hypothetical protein CPT_Palo_029 [Rhizobium phage Palo]
MSENFKDLINQAKQTENQSEAVAGGNYEYKVPDAGRTVARFIEYIELGDHVTMYQGKPKPAAPQVRVTFELLGKSHISEIDVEGGKKKVANRISVNMPKKQSDKAKFFKLFKAMAAGRTEITHMAEMLTEAFILDVVHAHEGEGDKKKTYANIYTEDQVWKVFAPRRIDDLAGTSEDISHMVPQPIGAPRIFLWGNPTKPTWDSLFIDGYNETKNADGTTTKVSKNWLQEKIMSATNYEGSALQSMLGGLDNLPTSGDSTSSESSKTQTESGNANAGAGTQTSVTASDDPLADLGL